MNAVLSFIEKGYTFDEGVAFLSLMAQPTLVAFIRRSHNMAYLERELIKQSKIPASVAKVQKVSLTERTEVKQAAPIHEEKQEAPEEPKQENKAQVTFDTLDRHKLTRFDDMLTELSRELWLQARDTYHTMQSWHEKMKLATSNESREEARTNVLALNAELKKLWNEIDTENANAVMGLPAEKPQEKKKEIDFDIHNYRAYISKNINRENISEKIKSGIAMRVKAIIEAGYPIEPETIEKVKAKGIEI